MNYIIRLAKEEDAEELSKLKHEVWNTTYRGIYADELIDNFDYEKHKNKFLKVIKDPNVDLYVVEENNSLIGYMSVGKPYRPFKDFEQEIGLLYLLKEYQGKGIGKELFNKAYNIIKDKGYQEFFISCNKYNEPAQGFYKKMGAEVINIDEDNIDKTIPQVTLLYKIKR